MKKAKLIAASLVVATMLSGAGYAYWTDSIKIDTTVNTGKLNVVFDKENCYTDDFWGDRGYIKVANPTFSELDKTMTVTIDNMYPGTEVCVNAAMKNTGTIPAVFDNAVVKFDNNDLTKPDVLRDSLEVPYLFGAVYDENGFWVKDLPTKTGFKLTELQGKINSMLKDVRLEPGQYVSFAKKKPVTGPAVSAEEHFDIKLPIGIKGQYQDLQNDHMTFSIQLNWKQHNAQ